MTPYVSSHRALPLTVQVVRLQVRQYLVSASILDPAAMRALSGTATYQDLSGVYSRFSAEAIRLLTMTSMMWLLDFTPSAALADTMSQTTLWMPHLGLFFCRPRRESISSLTQIPLPVLACLYRAVDLSLKGHSLVPILARLRTTRLRLHQHSLESS